MIEYKHVALRYTEKDILKDVNLRIENGEFMVLVGPSGSGKTTMIKMINRLLEPTDGNIYMDGKRIMDGKGQVTHDFCSFCYYGPWFGSKLRTKHDASEREGKSCHSR